MNTNRFIRRILHAIWNLRQHEGTPGHTQRMSDYTSDYRRACDDIELAIRTISDTQSASILSVIRNHHR